VDSPELYRRSASKRVRDLGDAIDPLHQGAQLLGRSIAPDLHVVGDRLGHRRVAGEIASHGYPDAGQLDPVGTRFAEQVVRDAAGDREIEQLAAVEAEPSSARFHGTIDDERVRPGRTDRCRLPVDVPELDLEHVRKDRRAAR
jgi:hypothetical protein